MDILFCCFQFLSVRTQNGRVTGGDLPPVFAKLKAFSEMFNEDEIKTILGESNNDMGEEIDFEAFLRVSLFSFQYQGFPIFPVYSLANDKENFNKSNVVN